MSAPETHQPTFEQKSSVQLSKNAKGEMQQVVKVYEGVDRTEVLRLVALAQFAYSAAELSPDEVASLVDEAVGAGAR